MPAQIGGDGHKADQDDDSEDKFPFAFHSVRSLRQTGEMVMGETLVNNLGGILTGAALFVTAVGTLLNIWFTHRTRVAVADVDKKVDDGAKEVQRAITDIAKTAVAATGAPKPDVPRSARRTDPKVD